MRRGAARSSLPTAGWAILALAGLLTSGALASCSSSAAEPDRPVPSTTAPPTGYAALGDSYSSGQGAGQYEAGTDADGDTCYRSPLAYGPLLDQAKQLGEFTFVACAGAVTSDLVNANHDGKTDPESDAVEPAQIGEIPATTKTVTVTIGGNDAGFASVLASCVLGKVGPINVFPHFFRSFDGCADDEDLNTTVTDRLQALAGDADAQTPAKTTIVPVTDLLSRIHQRAPQARIYLVGYPVLFGSFSGSCHVGDVDVVHVPGAGEVRMRLTVSQADAAWLNTVAGRLNDVLQEAAGAAASKGVSATFVGVSSQFTGHRLCDSSTSWIAPVSGNADIRSRTSGLDPSSFHPTQDGQRGGYEAALLSAGIS